MQSLCVNNKTNPKNSTEMTQVNPNIKSHFPAPSLKALHKPRAGQSTKQSPTLPPGGNPLLLQPQREKSLLSFCRVKEAGFRQWQCYTNAELSPALQGPSRGFGFKNHKFGTTEKLLFQRERQQVHMQSSLHVPMSFPLSPHTQMREKMHKDFFSKITKYLQVDKT